MRYWAVVLIWISVAIVTQFAPYPTTVWFYATQSSWSLLIVIFISRIMQSKTVLIVCFLETLHILFNLLSAYTYSYTEYHEKFIYIHYEVILQFINAIEAVVLIYGVPWGGIRSRIDSFFKRNSPISSRLFNNSSSLSGN